MNAGSRQVLQTIHDCIQAGRYRLLAHFVRRMDERGLFWPDILAVLDSATTVEDDKQDAYGRDKWKVCGRTTDQLELEIVCVLDRDDSGNLVVFITAYWEREKS